MAKRVQVGALRISDETFLVASMIERCPKTMMIRELIMNAAEAASRAPEGNQVIEIRQNIFNKMKKLSIYNTGPGMSGHELHKICDLASSIGKEKGLDENFGMGAKVASLPSNRLGLRYRSCKNSVVSEVILCERDGIYGRLIRASEEGNSDEVIDVTDVCIGDGYDLSYDWTEVLLYGNVEAQNTVRDPYNGDPVVIGQWLADYLYHRFFRLPVGIQLRFLPGTHKLDGARIFKTIPERAFPFGQHESVEAVNGIKIHYFYDPPLPGTSHNKSVSGAITTDVSLCSLIYKDEIYDVRRGRQWMLDGPIFGITFGTKHISIHVELPSSSAVRPEAYRQFLRYRDGDQRQVTSLDYAPLVFEHRPSWLIDVINSFAPADSGSTNDIRDDLQKLLNRLRVKAQSPRLDPAGSVAVERGGGKGASSKHGGASKDGQNASPQASDLLAIPAGAKRATISMNAERAPEIIRLYDEASVEEKQLKGKAARFYSESGQLFVNMKYSAVEEMTKQLEIEYAGANDVEFMRRLASDLAERTIIVRVGRAVIYALAKQLNREWSTEDMTRAQSPESLSLAADDFVDALQNARRRMGQSLRSGKQDALEMEGV